jgi:hypothetical protein
MKRHTLSRSERNDLNRDTGAVAENIAAAAYDRYSSFQESGAFDLATESGSIAEVKSTLTRLGNDNRGRFRLFKPQHEELLQADRDGSAFYIFVLFDISDRPEALLIRKSPATVGRLLGARGGWNRSGHSAGKQHKLPIGAIFDR